MSDQRIGLGAFPGPESGAVSGHGRSLHPYHLDAAPNVASPPADADWVTLADLPRLEGSLDRIQRVYGSHKRFPIYLTEYGLETNPPIPLFQLTPAQQAVYLNQAEYMAWRDPRVQMLSQYLLADAPPGGESLPISSFASGLEFINGEAKPSFAAYRLPIWMPGVRVKRGHSLEVWGCVRPAKRYPPGAIGLVLIQLNGRAVRSVRITNPSGYFDVRVTFPRSGTVRLACSASQGPTVYSRPVAIGVAAALIPTSLVATGIAGLLMLCCLVLARQLVGPARKRRVAGRRLAVAQAHVPDPARRAEVEKSGGPKNLTALPVA